MWPVVPKGFCSISAFSSPPLDYHSGVSVHHSWSTHSSGTWWQAHSDSVLGSPGSAFVFSKLCVTRLFFLQCPTFPFPWKRKWQPTPVFLPGKSHKQRSLVGYSPWGHKESVTTERLHFLSFYLPLPMSTYFCLASVVGLMQKSISWPSLVEADLSFVTAWILSSVKFPGPQSGTEYFSVYSLPTSNQSLWPGGGTVLFLLQI